MLALRCILEAIFHEQAQLRPTESECRIINDSPRKSKALLLLPVRHLLYAST